MKPSTSSSPRERVIHAVDTGSVITIDNGIKTLAAIASQNETYRDELWPYLLHHLESCRPKDVPQHAERTLPAVHAENKGAFILALEIRMAGMPASRAVRIKRVIKAAASK